jgi:hypothetical protein
MMFGVSNIGRAQDVLPCKCDVGTIFVGNVNCKFDVCIKDAAGFTCVTVGPGSTEFFKCHDQAVIFLTDCNGNLVQINNNKTNCVSCICVGKGCCVDACVGFDAKGCIYVKIGPSACGKC